MNILIINGPNLNMLEYRSKEIYGEKNFDWLKKNINNDFPNDTIKIVQTNSESKFIEYIHEAIVKKIDGLIVNPGAYSHYSYAIRDALEIFSNVKVEIHLSDVKNRENFRKKLVNEDVVDLLISGLYIEGYLEGIKFIKNKK